MPHGLAACRGGGSRSSGRDWKVTGRSQRRIAVAPTEVWAELVVEGHGPPWDMAQETATPVGQPFQMTRPARSDSRASRRGRGNGSAGSPWTVAVSEPSIVDRTANRSSSDLYS